MTMHLKSKHFLSLLVIQALLSPCCLLADGDKTDSLRQVISSNPGGRQAVDNMLALSSVFLDLELADSSTRYVQMALDLSTDLGYKIGIAESNFRLYRIEVFKSNFPKAVGYVKIYIEICEEINDEVRLGKGYFSYSNILGNLGKADSALYYIRKSLVINSQLKDTVRLIATYNGLGNIYQNQTEHDSAIYYYLKSAQLCELSGNLNYVGAVYLNLGNSFSMMRDYEKAIYYLEQALEINKKKNNSRNIALTLVGLGSAYIDSDSVDKGLLCYDQALEIYESIGMVNGIADIYNNYATVFTDQGNLEKALEYFKKANELYSNQDYTEGISKSLKNIGDTYSQMGQYQLAALMLDSSLRIATAAGYMLNRHSALYQISRNYYRSGNYKSAFDYYEKAKNLDDSLMSLEKIKVVNELEKKYQKEKDQLRILTLEKENLKKTLQRNAGIYSAIGILMLAAFIVIYFLQKSKKDRIISRQKIIQLEEEKKLMTAKILLEGQEEERKRIAQELHDGLGVLLSATKMHFTLIKDKSPKNRPLIEKATQMLEQASGDVRKISHNMMPGLLTKLGFYEAVDDLIDNISDTQDIVVKMEIEGDQSRLPENKEIMLYRVTQEMVNNTLKHANAKNIFLKMTRLSDSLEIIFTDDGIGFETEKAMNAETSSLGLKSIESRIGFLNGQVMVDSSPGNGTRYTIRIPL